MRLQPALICGDNVHLLNPRMSREDYAAVVLDWARGRDRSRAAARVVAWVSGAAVAVLAGVSLLGFLALPVGPTVLGVAALAWATGSLAGGEVRRAWTWDPPRGNYAVLADLPAHFPARAVAASEWGGPVHWEAWSAVTGAQRPAPRVVPTRADPEARTSAAAAALWALLEANEGQWPAPVAAARV